MIGILLLRMPWATMRGLTCGCPPLLVLQEFRACATQSSREPAAVIPAADC